MSPKAQAKLEANHARLAALSVGKATPEIFDIDGGPVEDLTLAGEDLRFVAILVPAKAVEDPGQGMLF